MSGILKRVKDYIKLQEFGLSDFLLLVGFIFSLPFYIFSWSFTVTKDPNDIFFKPAMMIVCFAMTMLCWGTAFFLEIKRGRIKNHPFLWIFLFFQVYSLIIVLVQPRIISVDVVHRSLEETSIDLAHPEIVHLDIMIPWQTRMMFAFATLVINWFVYILLIYLPKRIKGTDIIIGIGWTVIIFMFILTLYSFIAEAKNYGPYINAVTKGEILEIKHYAMRSFIVNSVPYGSCMMVGMIFSIFVHALTKKWYYWIPIVYFFINMFFSYYRSALIISSFTLLFYIVFRTVLTFKEHKKRNIIFSCTFGTVLITFISLVIASLSTHGSFLPVVNNIFSPFLQTSSIKSRTFIWKNINEELKNGWWLLGRGFGIHNYILYPMNLVNGDPVSPSHSTFYAVLGPGGVVNVIGFYALCAYFIYIAVKCWKVDKEITIGLCIGFIAYFANSITEGVNYILCGMMIPLFFYYHSVVASKKIV